MRFISPLSSSVRKALIAVCVDMASSSHMVRIDTNVAPLSHLWPPHHDVLWLALRRRYKNTCTKTGSVKCCHSIILRSITTNPLFTLFFAIIQQFCQFGIIYVYHLLDALRFCHCSFDKKEGDASGDTPPSNAKHSLQITIIMTLHRCCVFV